MAEIVQAILEVSTYAALLVLAFILFFKMHKHAIDKIQENSNNSVKEIKEAYEDSYNKLMLYIDRHSK